MCTPRLTALKLLPALTDSPRPYWSKVTTCTAYFFFGDGVHNTSKLTVVAQDDTNWQQQWNKLIELQNLDSVVCVTSAIKRGIIDEAESARHELGAVSLSSSSEISGLGQLIDATINSDRVINFG